MRVKNGQNIFTTFLDLLNVKHKDYNGCDSSCASLCAVHGV